MHFIFLGALCNTPLGLQNGRLRNSRITASSEYNVYTAARLGRLGLHKRGRYVGAWSARHNNKNQWIKVDFGRTMKITKIATQGRQDAAQWVTYYKVSSSLDGVHWQVYRFKNSDKVRITLSGITLGPVDIRRISALSNAIQTKDNEANDLIIYCLNCIRPR